MTPKDLVYQIITDRFVDGDTANNVPSGFDPTLFDGSGTDLKLYQGGDWQGIVNKIPYLKNMGVTVVWISAPYANRDTAILDYQPGGGVDRWTSFHGYHVRNYFTTNKHFGSLNQFKALRDALHAQGMKLVIDFVTNHIPELGSWDPAKAPEAMMNPNYPEWFLPVSVPKGTQFQFKFIKKDSNGNVVWEGGANRVFTSPSSSTGTTDTTLYYWQ